MKNEKISVFIHYEIQENSEIIFKISRLLFSKK